MRAPERVNQVRVLENVSFNVAEDVVIDLGNIDNQVPNDAREHGNNGYQVSRRPKRKKKAKKQSSERQPHYYNHESVQGFVWSTTWHAIFTFLIPSVIGLLQVMYQSKGVSPFETHAANIWVFFTATCIYCLAFATKMKAQTHGTSYSRISGHVSLISGALAFISLTSILLPHLPGRLIFIIWALFSLVITRGAFQHIYRWLSQKIMKAFSKRQQQPT